MRRRRRRRRKVISKESKYEKKINQSSFLTSLVCTHFSSIFFSGILIKSMMIWRKKNK